MQGYLIAFLATASWAISIFPLTKASRIMPVNSLNHFRLVLSSVLMLIIAWIIDGQNFFSIFSSAYTNAWIWLGVSGFLSLVLGDFLSFRMYAILSPRFGSVLTTLSPAAALLLGLILLEEGINFVGILGMLITIAGVMSISLGRAERNTIPDHGHGSVAKGITFGILAAMCHGAGLALSKKGFLVQEAEGYTLLPLSATFIRVLAGTVLLMLISTISGRISSIAKDIRTHKGQALRLAAAGSVFSPVLAVSFSMIAILFINVAVAQTIFALVPLFALIISHFVYKEKVTRQALVGVAIALVGVVILIWREKIVSGF